jgi:aryl-alcohol dehydrogenase-like predicted oxidoreductase
MIGLGCMRLSTAPQRDDARAIQVIHAALDAGATLLDTADSYCHDESDAGHNERLVAEALRTWRGDRCSVEVATKGGLRRPAGRWVPDGRAAHLRAACDASRRALATDTIDLYLLHAVDPRTPLETSVRALAALRDDGAIRRVGLCNVTVDQIAAARRIVDVAAVQVGLGVLDAENLWNGVAEYCRDHGIRLIAHRPLGGDRRGRIARDPALREVAQRHGATPFEIALAWLRDLDPIVVPIPGATSVASARSLRRVLDIRLTPVDRARLDDEFPAGRLLRSARADRRPPPGAEGEVVLVMGMPGAGKSTVARELVERGYERLNRDREGGPLSGLVCGLDAGLAAGRRRWVLDNTYASRRSRAEVLECAWAHGVPVRCVWVQTSTADAQINAVTRLLAVHGRLPGPDELRALGRTDHRFFGPDAQFRYERQLEPPAEEEGFAAIDLQPFVRGDGAARGRAAVFEFDDVLCVSARGGPVALEPGDVAVPDGRRAVLARLAAEGWTLLAIAWRPQIAAGDTDDARVRQCFERASVLLGVAIDIAHCPHPPGPPVCWCRKPLPGLMLALAFRHGIALERSLYVGRSPADRTLARRLGMTYHEAASFFAD